MKAVVWHGVHDVRVFSLDTGRLRGDSA